MSKVIPISQVRFVPSSGMVEPVRISGNRSIAHYRQLLYEMRLRPAPQRAFLRRFLMRAAANGAFAAFPVAVPAVLTPATP
jgi:hypothetical protein